jgi:hypothetical protein
MGRLSRANEGDPEAAARQRPWPSADAERAILADPDDGIMRARGRASGRDRRLHGRRVHAGRRKRDRDPKAQRRLAAAA